MSKKIVLGLRLVFFSFCFLSLAERAQAQSAPILINASLGEECPAGTVEQDLGLGFISGGVFISDPLSSFFIEQCIGGGNAGLATIASQLTRNSTNEINYHFFRLANQHFFNAVKFDPEKEGFQQSNSENKLAASSDLTNNLPKDFWGTTSITQISDDQGPQSDTDIYQFVGGFDQVQGDFIYGAALTYAHTEDEQVRVRMTADTVGITPYIAYKITDFLFASTMLGYNYTHFNSVGGRSDVDANDFYSETNFNFFKKFNDLVVKGRAGLRYKHTHTTVEKSSNGVDDDYDELTWIGDIEFGYTFANNVQIYTGLLYEYYDREISNVSTTFHDGIGFMRYGAEYPINKSLMIGAKIEHDISDEDNDYITGSINARLAF